MNRGQLAIFTGLEDTSEVYFQNLPAAVRADVRDLGVYSFHAVPMEMDRRAGGQRS